MAEAALARIEQKRTLDAAPIIKWVGGKRKLLPEIRQRMPVSFERYFEPFIGGGALFFKTRPQVAFLNDFNPDLVNMYKHVAKNTEGIARRLTVHRRNHTDEYYYKIRDRFNRIGRTLDPLGRAAAFIYLNKTCFNGLWRVNRAGSFNVPIGRYSSPKIFSPEALENASALLKRAKISRGDYRDAVKPARSGDFVYFDPPYHPVSDTANFTSYTNSAFGPTQQQELAVTARELADRGCNVMLSNSDTPFIRKIYKDFQLHNVLCPRAINSNAKKRGLVGELLITSYS